MNVKLLTCLCIWKYVTVLFEEGQIRIKEDTLRIKEDAIFKSNCCIVLIMSVDASTSNVLSMRAVLFMEKQE